MLSDLIRWGVVGVMTLAVIIMIVRMWNNYDEEKDDRPDY